MNRKLTLLSACIVAGTLATSCSARPERFVEDPVEEQGDKRVLTPEEKGIPTLADIEYIDGEPEVSIAGSLGTTQAFNVGPIKVIHKATPANQVVAGRLYILGGAQNLTSTTEGIERLALTVATNGGTATTPKDEFNGKLDSMGASVWGFADRDYSGYGFKTITSNFDETWELFEQTIIEPEMPEGEVELRRNQQLASIKSMLEDPDSHVQHVATRNFFDGHPYYHLQLGTEENVQGFTRDDLLAYQRSLLKPERMLLVVVGNVSAQKLIEQVKEKLARIKPSETEMKPLPPFGSATGLRVADRELPTNYVLGYFPTPKPGDIDYPAAVVALEYLRDKLFEEVRTKRNLTYAVASGISTRRMNYGYVYTTAKDPKTTMGVIFDQIEEMKLIQIPKAELDEVVNVYLTNHYMELQTNDGQANMLAEAEIVAGDWKHSAAFLAEVRSVTPDDVQAVAQKYFTNYRFGVVGAQGKLDKTAFNP